MKIIRLSYKIFLFCSIAIIISIIGLYTNAYFSSPIELTTVGTYHLYDNNNELVYQGSTKNEWTSIDDVSDNFINAIVSVEDKNFYKHNGFDYLRILKAIFKNISKQEIVEGASTISQQYIKNAYLNFDKSWSRKIKEAFMTLNLEVHYSKEKILEAYINTINFGQGNYGISSAASYYFNKSPKDLTLEEAIILAGIPKNPSRYNPATNKENAIQRAKTVALSMYNNKVITNKDYTTLFINDIDVSNGKNSDELKMLTYYQDAIINELKQKAKLSDEAINSGTLHVYSTLDINIQKELENQIYENIKDDELQVAGVAIDPESGGVLALTGGMDYSKSQFNRALNSKRQVGSTMKPFLYYSAIEHGMTSASKFMSQYTTFNLDNGNVYAPKNWANIYGNKEITMAAAVAYSDNIYAVKTNLFLGTDELVNIAHKCGIKANLQSVPSLALGTSEINLLDFANGYTTFASGGYDKPPYFINKVTDNDGNILYEHEEKNNLILNPNYVFILNELLTSTTNPAFVDYNTPTALSLANKITDKYALKSGTTDTDYWVVGYNKKSFVMLWVGYDNNKLLDISVSPKLKNVWANTIEYIKKEKGLTNTWYQQPYNVTGVLLNSINGTITKDKDKASMFYFVRGSEPI